MTWSVTSSGERAADANASNDNTDATNANTVVSA
jgi:hypothetical protein